MDASYLQDYSRWAKFDWHPIHAAILTLGLFPISAEDNCRPPVLSEKTQQDRYEWISILIDKAIKQGRLQNPINPRAYVEWAAKYKVDLPEELVLQIDLTYGTDELGERERNSYLNMIAALLEILNTKIPRPNGELFLPYGNQSAIIERIIAAYGKKAGLSQSNLEKKFKDAKDNLSRSE